MYIKLIGDGMHQHNGILNLIASKAASLAYGVFLALICLSFADSAQAVNGFAYTTSCNCKTTADFKAAASAAAQAQVSAGTYQVVSTSKAMTSTVSVSGYQAQFQSGPNGGWVTVFIPQSEVPIDSSGQSLLVAGATESTLDSYYTAYDQVIFGTNRTSPLFSSNVSSQYFPPSFVNTTDGQMSAAIDEWLGSIGVTVGLPATLTISFADGTTAEFQGYASGLPWRWNGIAHNKKKQLINRNGTIRPNPNTSGNGGGSASVSAPGAGGVTYNWNLSGNVWCTQTVTVTWGTGPGDLASSVGTYFIAC